jgi:hypothetical protein
MMFRNPILFPVTGWRGFSERLVVFFLECCATCHLEVRGFKFCGSTWHLEIIIVVLGLLLWDSARLIFVAGGRRSTKCMVMPRAACCAKRSCEKLRGWQRCPEMESVWPRGTSLDRLLLCHDGRGCPAAFSMEPAWRILSCCWLQKNSAVLGVGKFGG